MHMYHITVYFQNYFVFQKKNRNKSNFLKKDELTIGELHVGRPYLLMIVILLIDKCIMCIVFSDVLSFCTFRQFHFFSLSAL